jgi:hypothetical protein
MRVLLQLSLVLFQLSSLAKPVVCEFSDAPGTQAAKEETKTEILNPLTEEEHSLNLRDILLSQPDFVADLSFFVNEGFGGYGGAEHVARKGERYREESQFWTFVGEIGKTTVRLYPNGKVYDEMQPSRVSAVDASLLYPKPFALGGGATLLALGTTEFDGHRCLKIEVMQKDRTEKVYLYAALDLKNLIVVKQELGPKQGSIQKLTKVSLEVPDALIEIPSDYKPIAHDKWTKIESAKVTYKDKVSKDYGVFRAPGGELFVWVSDAYYPWHYLYRPQDKTVEIAFQGLLVNRSGTYIWKTKETEAFSSINYSGASRTTIDAHLVVLPNGIKFRSESYEQDGSIIEISW